MIYFGLNVDMFQPSSTNLIVTLLYSTWWGFDYILSFISSIVFFWGFTTLFIKVLPRYQKLLSKISEMIVGDAAKFSTLSSSRNLKKTGATIFMVALIVSYSRSIGLARLSVYSRGLYG